MAIGQRIAKAVETYQLLPEGQMGNRKEQSIELAIQIVTNIVFTA